MENEEGYDQVKRNLMRAIIDTGDDYTKFGNSFGDSSFSSINSSSNDMYEEESTKIMKKQKQKSKAYYIWSTKREW